MFSMVLGDRGLFQGIPPLAPVMPTCFNALEGFPGPLSLCCAKFMVFHHPRSCCIWPPKSPRPKVNFPKKCKDQTWEVTYVTWQPDLDQKLPGKNPCYKGPRWWFQFFFEFFYPYLGKISHFDSNMVQMGLVQPPTRGIWAMFFLAHLRWIFDKLDGAPVAKTLQQETDVSKNNWNFVGLSFFCLGGGLIFWVKL